MLILGGKERLSLKSFKQHSQRIRSLIYDYKCPSADDIVSSLNDNYEVFPEYNQDDDAEDEHRYVCNFYQAYSLCET